MTDLSIIIVNFNTEEHLSKCLDSIYSSKINCSYEIIIIDNNSGSDRIYELLSRFPGIILKRLDNNYGFGCGCNEGAKIAGGKYLLFLNPNILVKLNSVNYLFEFAENNNNISAFTGLLQNNTGRLLYSYNNFPDILWEFKEAFGISVMKTINELLAREEIIYGIPFEIDWTHGACLMIRKDLFNQIKGFDEKIFLYYEDVDIQKRIKDKGFKIYCIPNSRFTHFERSSVKENKSQNVYYFYMHFSKLYYMKKHLSFIERETIRAFYIAGYITKTIILLFRRKYKHRKLMYFNYYKMIIGIYLNLIKELR